MQLDKAFLIVLLATYVSSAPPVLAAKEPAQMLIEQARLWEKRNRPDLARQSWEKLLKISPDHPEALSALALLEARSGQQSKAQTYIARLNEVRPGHPVIAEVADILKMGGNLDDKINVARKLASEGRHEEAANQYKAIFKGHAPSGDLGLEYYQTIGGTQEGWEEARAGLEKLARENPDDFRYQLAFAQHLTYRESHRRQGIHLLADMARRPEHAAKVIEAWRKALIWLNARKTDIPLYERFLQARPDDEAIKKRLAKLTDGSEGNTKNNQQLASKRLGFEAIESGALHKAEEAFLQALAKNPNDADALGGLGIVRLRQERFAEARDLLARARDIKPRTRDKWSEAYNSAKYWALIREAEASRQSGDIASAGKKLADALKLKPTDPTALLMQADIALEGNDYDKADTLYERVIAVEPNNANALRGRINVLIRKGNEREALAILDRLSDEQRRAVGLFSSLRAKILRVEAEEMLKSGRAEEAVARLEDALLIDPDNVWIRLELARLYSKQGLSSQAHGLLESTLALDTSNPDALYANALFQSEQGDAWHALQTLERVPTQFRNTAMRSLQRRLWVKVQGQRAIAYARSGLYREAKDIIARAEQAAGQDAELMGDVAVTYAELGDHGRALATMRKILSQQTNPSAGVRLQYAAILLKTGQDAELALVLRQLAQQTNLTEQERQAYNDIFIGQCQRNADALREAGNLAAAYDALAPALELRPDAPSLLISLARMYDAADEPAEAIRIYQRAISKEPDNLDARIALIGALMKVKDFDGARRELDIVLKQAPDNPRALTIAGRLAKALGEPALAVDYFRRAMLAEQMPGESGRFVSDLRMLDSRPLDAGNPPVRYNPFANRSEQRDGVSPSNATSPQARYFSGKRSEQAPAYQPETIPGYITPPGSKTDLSSTRRTEPAILATSSSAKTPAISGTAGSATPLAVSPSLIRMDHSTSSRSQSLRDPTPEEEIMDIESRHSASIAVGSGFQTRTGETGLSKLQTIEPLITEARVPVGYDGHFFLRLDTTLLDAGSINLENRSTTSRVGRGLSAVRVPPLGSPINYGGKLALTSGNAQQSDSGMAVAIGYANERLRVDLGTTPIGFQETSLVGGLKLSGEWGDLRATLDLSRRPVTDSLLSYAGARDVNTGETWGGVVASGARFRLSHEADRLGLYGTLSFHRYTGHNVMPNSRYEVGGGGYWKFIDQPDMRLSAGINLTALGFAKNLRYFTYGHGGYFSPQSYYSLAAPIELSGRYGRLAYQLAGSVGLQHFTEDAAPYFPSDSSHQALWEGWLTSGWLPAGAAAYYPGQSKTGLGLALSGSAEYKVTDRLFLGGQLSLDNARDYNMASGMVYLRYDFSSSRRPIAFPPKPIIPYAHLSDHP